MEEKQIHIPNLDLLYKEVRDFVKKNQGEEGYIFTVRKGCDNMYAFVLESEEYTPFSWDEIKMQAIRVNDDDLQIIAIPNVDIESIADVTEDDWYSVKLSYDIHYIPTLFSIAESIEQYLPATDDDYNAQMEELSRDEKGEDLPKPSPKHN